MKGALLILIILALGLPLLSRADAPVETYFVDRTQISAALLRDICGVLSVGLLDPQHDASAYRGTPTALPIYRKQSGGFIAAGTLKMEQILTPSGGVYEGMHWYRFPVLAAEGDYLQLICNLAEGRRCWIKPAELARPWSPGGKEAPQSLWFADGGDPLTIDLFFLARDEQTFLYTRPQLDAPRQRITPASKLLSSYEAYDPRALQLSERKNGFGHLVKITGCDTPPHSIGWVRLRDDQGLLQVWPIMGAGC